MAKYTKKRRSAAAKKGWITRRANLAKPKRSRKTKRGRKPAKAVPVRRLFRITVAANYYIRQKRKSNRRGGSPESAAYFVRGWFEKYLEASSYEDEFIERAEAGREEAVDAHDRAFHTDQEPNVEVVEVDFDERLIGIIEERDEP